MNISALFRADQAASDPLKPPSVRNPGGGVGVKLKYLKQAIPNISVVNDIDDVGDVVLIEALWLSSPEFRHEGFQQNLDRIERHPSFKILWTSDVVPLKWQGSERERVFDIVDGVAGNSEYFRDMIAVYTPTVLLTDPVNIDEILIGDKSKSVFSMSNISLQKGISQLVEIYGKLRNVDFSKEFIGSSSLWGEPIDPVVSNEIETMLFNASDKVHQNLSHADMLSQTSEMFAFTGVTRYESFCYAMVFAMLAGCWCVCGDHPVYNERDSVISRFGTVNEAVRLIKRVFDEHYPTPNEAARQFVIDNYSIDVFKNQFLNIVGGGIF